MSMIALNVSYSSAATPLSALRITLRSLRVTDGLVERFRLRRSSSSVTAPMVSLQPSTRAA